MTDAEMIQQALLEDMPQGDLTSDRLGLTERLGDARLVAKEDLVLAGQALFTKTMLTLDPTAHIKWQFDDGKMILSGQTACWLKGNLIQMLKAERVALNFLGRLSGIATLTRCFVNETKGTNCRILDTRKTAPLFRRLEKAAVRAGGGFNHRMNLSDAVLIKENHVRAIGDFKRAVEIVKKDFAGKVEVECGDLSEVKMAVELRVDRILLDNMTLEQMSEARDLIPHSIEVEASGNMTLERIQSVAKLGVDYISVGALTHSSPCADFSLLFEWTKGDL